MHISTSTSKKREKRKQHFHARSFCASKGARDARVRSRRRDDFSACGVDFFAMRKLFPFFISGINDTIARVKERERETPRESLANANWRMGTSEY